MKTTINLPKWSKTINKTFIPLVNNQDRYLLCYGGRGSSKSVFAAKNLVYRCLNEPYFRFILYRETFNTIKESQYQTIKDVVEEWKLESLFTFKVSPLEINCVNGNRFICRGGDDPRKLKSIKDPTGVWYEEEIPPEVDFITITTSIRTKKAKYLQEIFTINPEVEGDYTEHWLWKRFFKGHDELSFSAKTEVLMPDGKIFQNSYTCHQSTYLDNRWIPDSFKAQLIELKASNPYYYTIYAQGMWGNKTSDGQFYKLFSMVNNTGRHLYDKTLPLHVSFDFNVNPHMTACVWQIVGKEAKQISEVCLSSPDNTTKSTCAEFTRRYMGHAAGVFVYGDPAGKHEDTRSEKGFNDYTIIMKELQPFRPQLRLANMAPAVVMRGMFINTVFLSGYEGLTLSIDTSCTKTLGDYQHLKEAADGTKAKIKVRKDGVSSEEHGHTSDANDYFICMAFAGEYGNYQRGGTPLIRTIGKNVSKNSY